ncbi:3-oxoacyl-ACP synthase III family protein [Carboxylicivirga sp. RSCT41]|uniref:3-oxoacyl-ACP synthase III family protein n=1 Tax=Carboxylicivirga agarovorans TaxID=3417570 RepID=UPI003D329ACC
MNLKYTNKKITGLLTVIPENEVQFVDTIENYNFSKRQSMQLGKIMGYEKQRIVQPGVTVSDMCIFGLNYLFDKGLLSKDEIDALILVTESPDYILPPTSNVIQGALNLGHDVFCMDINQGCAGHVVGLMQAFSLLDQDAINKVVLLNADVLSPKASVNDRNSRPLAGDGASITIVEKSEEPNEIYANMKMDGTRHEALIIPAGGFKTPSSPETAKLIEDDNGNLRALDHLCMKGDAVFNFVQKEVPIMVESLLDYANVHKDDIDYFMFHQPNKFMLKKLADRMEVSYDRLPNNIVERFGNANSITVPTVITYNLGEKAEKQEYLLCLAGFGVGLTWCSMLLKFGKLDFCKMIEY